MRRSMLLQAVCGLVLCCVSVGTAYGHAIVIESSPKNGEALSEPPAEAVLRFNARIEKKLANVVLLKNGGTVVPLQGRGENATEETADVLRIRLPVLEDGSYVLRYKVLATDGHATLGELRFTLKGKAARP